MEHQQPPSDEELRAIVEPPPPESPPAGMDPLSAAVHAQTAGWKSEAATFFAAHAELQAMARASALAAGVPPPPELKLDE